MTDGQNEMAEAVPEVEGCGKEYENGKEADGEGKG